MSLGDKMTLVIPVDHIASNQIILDRNAIIDWYKAKSPDGIRVWIVTATPSPLRSGH